MSQKCGNCRFYKTLADNKSDKGVVIYQDSINVCKRYPPKTAPNYTHATKVDGQSGLRYTYPVTEEWQWCGEYQIATPETAEQAMVTLAQFVLLGDMTAARALADKLRE